MRELSLSQHRVISDFFGNVAVGWFGAGVISPFLVPPQDLVALVARVGWGLVMTYVFIRVALSLAGEKR